MPTLNYKSIRFTPQRKAFEGMKQNNYDLYNSSQWRKYRKDFLLRNPLCRMCDAKGLITPATYVDHIVPINKGGEVWDESNHQPLCKSCHAAKSARDGKE